MTSTPRCFDNSAQPVLDRLDGPLAGLPVESYTAASVREIDRLAIAAGTPGGVLMKRAARAALATLTSRWPEATTLAVYCGAGNNGGDGYWLATLAAERGMTVQLIAIGDTGKLSGDARLAYELACGAGLQVLTINDELPSRADVVVDAMLGTGLNGAPRDTYQRAIVQINRSTCPVLALDIPSGLCSDTGRMLGSQAVVADATVTFIAMKCGLLTGDARACVGQLVFADLAIVPASYAHLESRAELATLSRWHGHLPRRRRTAYKNQCGHLLIIGGDTGMSGAPLLAAMAALRCGAGLVSVATHREHVGAIVCRQPDVMAHGVSSNAELAPLLRRATAIVIGPGLGQSSWAKQMLLAVRDCPVPRLLDADALNLVAAEPQLRPRGDWSMTPHPGEAGRLLERYAADVGGDRFGEATALLTLCGGAVVLKGAGSVVASANQSASTSTLAVCPYGNPGMATAGMGDVLSGVIGSLLAQGLAAGDAALLGTLLHSASADCEAAMHGEHGLVASDLPTALRRLLSALSGLNSAVDDSDA